MIHSASIVATFYYQWKSKKYVVRFLLWAFDNTHLCSIVYYLLLCIGQLNNRWLIIDIVNISHLRNVVLNIWLQYKNLTTIQRWCGYVTNVLVSKNTQRISFFKEIKESCVWMTSAFMRLLWSMLKRLAYTKTVWNISNLCFSTPFCISCKLLSRLNQNSSFNGKLVRDFQFHKIMKNFNLFLIICI